MDMAIARHILISFMHLARWLDYFYENLIAVSDFNVARTKEVLMDTGYADGLIWQIRCSIITTFFLLVVIKGGAELQAQCSFLYRFWYHRSASDLAR